MKFALFVVLLMFVSIASAKIYTWTDENGNKVFSNVPPRAEKQQKVEEFVFKEDQKLAQLPLTSENLYGKWREIESGNQYISVELSPSNRFTMFKYQNDIPYYKGAGQWNVENSRLKMSFDLIINQQSNYRSNDPVIQFWPVKSLTEQELVIAIENKEYRLGIKLNETVIELQ